MIIIASAPVLKVSSCDTNKHINQLINMEIQEQENKPVNGYKPACVEYFTGKAWNLSTLACSSDRPESGSIFLPSTVVNKNAQGDFLIICTSGRRNRNLRILKAIHHG